MQKDLQVYLGDVSVGLLTVKDNVSRFHFLDSYRQMDHRPILGQFFEEDLDKEYKSNMKLPEWFSNLLPEGKLKDWAERDLSGSKMGSVSEAMLLQRLGNDLPGAVKIIDSEAPAEWYNTRMGPENNFNEFRDAAFRFSLAGVAMKFSTLKTGDRFVAPAKFTQTTTSLPESWIVKLPEPSIPGLCVNEYYTMEFARSLELDVPAVKIVDIDNLDESILGKINIPDEPCYAVQRFDRNGSERIHMEDFCQVFGKYPHAKYESAFESIINVIIDRSSDPGADYKEAIRRILFNLLIDNGDAHLKNWSLLYQNPSKARLSPLYDVSSTGMHANSISGLEHDLGLKLNRNKRFERVSRYDFRRIEKKSLKDRGVYCESVYGKIDSIIDEFLDSVNDGISSYKSQVDCEAWISHVEKNISRMSKRLAA